MKSKEVKFKSKEGTERTATLELPIDQKPAHFAIFIHCLGGDKNVEAVKNISLALSQSGLGVLRLYFAGEDYDADYSSCEKDIRAAAEFLENEYEEPGLLVGHSMGGAAALIAGSKMASVKAIATIGARYNPEQAEQLKKMRDRSVLVMHSPQDEEVDIDNARLIYEDLYHPKSFISLDGADHLLSHKEDSAYAGSVIASWVQRYLPEEEIKEMKTDEQVLARLDEGPFLTEILAGRHHLLADEPISVGGSNFGPTPYEFLASGLGACTAMTIKMYADRKKWPLEEVKVHLSYDNNYLEDCEKCEDEDRKIGKFQRIIEVKGDIDDDQRQRILEIANKCPVHKTMEQGVTIESKMEDIQ